MSPRPGLMASIRKPADGGRSPNNYVAAITAEVRLHWPPLAHPSDVEAALAEAYENALAQFRAHPLHPRGGTA